MLNIEEWDIYDNEYSMGDDGDSDGNGIGEGLHEDRLVPWHNDQQSIAGEGCGVGDGWMNGDGGWLDL